MTEAIAPALAQEVAALRASVEMLVRMTAPRMTRDEVCARLRIHLSGGGAFPPSA